MADKSVAMFITDDDGQRTQVGWASPATDGARTFELLKGHENVKLRDVSFEDDELVDKEQAEVQASDPNPETDETLNIESNDSLTANVDAAPDAELADDPTDAGVELSNGGEITDISYEEDQDNIRQELEKEEARQEEGTNERRNRNRNGRR